MASFRISLFVLHSVSILTSGHAHFDPYRELWTNQIKSLQTEIGILHYKVTEGERRMADTQSELESLAVKCGASQTVNEEVKETVLERDELVALRRAFRELKLYTYQLDKKLEASQHESQTTLGNMATQIGEMETRHQQNVNEIEADYKRGLDEMAAGSRRRVDELNATNGENIESVRETVSRIHQRMGNVERGLVSQKASDEKIQLDLREVQAENNRLKVSVESNSQNIGLVSMRGCKSGTFGDGYFSGISYPREYDVYFGFWFDDVPHFMYAIRLLDSDAVVRVEVEVIELDKFSARVRVKTWEDYKLYGVSVTWMACP